MLLPTPHHMKYILSNLEGGIFVIIPVEFEKEHISTLWRSFVQGQVRGWETIFVMSEKAAEG